MKVMKRLGYDLNFVVIDSPKDIGAKELLRRIGSISSESSKKTDAKIKALYGALKVINLIDEIEKSAHVFAGFESNRGECKSLLNQCKYEAMKSSRSEEMIKILRCYREKINNIAVDANKAPLKIAIIGEIYTVIEPYTNFNIEDKLMDYGVSSMRELTPSWWVRNMALSPFKINSLKIRTNARNYLPVSIGGHAVEIGRAHV